MIYKQSPERLLGRIPSLLSPPSRGYLAEKIYQVSNTKSLNLKGRASLYSGLGPGDRSLPRPLNLEGEPILREATPPRKNHLYC